MSSYTKSVLKPVFNMSKDQYTNHDKAAPLRKLIGNVEKNTKITEYTIITDLRIGHNNGWDEVKKMMVKLHFQREEEGQLPEKFKLEEIKRENSFKSGYFQVTLPNKDEIIEGDTGDFLVLIPSDKETVIMPAYYNFLGSLLNGTNKSGNTTITKKFFLK